jgi:3',5'-cyclic-AMP phosphodiesterase
MTAKSKDELLHDHNHDGVDRRGFLKCMAWAGTGAFCIMQGGILKSYSMSQMSQMAGKIGAGELRFVQISDSHMGFNKAANPDVVGTLKTAVDKVNALSTPAEFMLHTGDISHLSKPEEFDTVDQILKDAKPKDIFYVPGDDNPHTAVTDKIFKSKVMHTDEKFSFTFSKPGTYEYFCSIHPKMTGKIVVQ